MSRPDTQACLLLWEDAAGRDAGVGRALVPQRPEQVGVVVQQLQPLALQPGLGDAGAADLHGPDCRQAWRRHSCPTVLVLRPCNGGFAGSAVARAGPVFCFPGAGTRPR